MSARRGVGWLALGCIALQFGGRLDLSLLALGLWLGVMVRVDPAGLRRLARPHFWAVSVVVALASGFLLGQADLRVLGLPLSVQGLQAGALMLVRGAFIFSLSTWASRAVRVEDLERWAGRLGHPELGGAVAVALGLLPGLVQRLGPGWRGWRSPAGVMDEAVRVMVETALLAEDMAARQEPARKPPEAA